jgi:hypothetical protein
VRAERDYVIGPERWRAVSSELRLASRAVIG